MSWLWGSGEKDQKEESSFSQKDQKEAYSFLSPRSSPRSEVGALKGKSSSLTDFISKLEAQASEMSSGTRQADEKKKKLPTFKGSVDNSDSKKPTFKLDAQTDSKGSGMESSRRPGLSVLDRVKLLEGARSTPNLEQQQASEYKTSGGFGLFDEKPTSLASSKSEPANKFSSSYDKQPLREKLPSFAETLSTGASSRFSDEKSPVSRAFSKTALDTWSSLSNSHSVSSAAWSTLSTSRSASSLDGADQKFADDEARLLVWDQAAQEVDIQQAQVLGFQSKLQREQVHTLTADSINMRLDITELYRRCAVEQKERTEAIQHLKVALFELTRKNETDATSHANSDSQHNLEGKLAKLQKSLADAASKSELGELKKDLERETKQRLKSQQTLEDNFSTKAELKSLKVDLERDGRDGKPRSAEPIVSKDALSKLHAEFDDKIKRIQSSLGQVREEVDSTSVNQRSLNSKTFAEERRKSVKPLQEALENEVKARMALGEEMYKIFNELGAEVKKGIDANRAEIEINRSNLNQMHTEMLDKRIDELHAVLENERANRASQDEKQEEDIRNLADSLSKQQIEQSKETQRGLAVNKAYFEKEQLSTKTEVERLVALVHSSLAEERKLRKQAIATVEQHLATHSSQIGDSHASHVDKYEDTLKRLTEQSKDVELVKRSHHDELESMRRRHEDVKKDLEKNLSATVKANEQEISKMVTKVNNLNEKLETLAKEHKNLIGEVQERVKNESKDRLKVGAEHTRRLDQASRSREDDIKRLQKVDEDVKKLVDKLQQEAQKKMEIFVNQSNKKLETLDAKLTTDIKKQADERVASTKDMKDLVKYAWSEQNDKLDNFSKDMTAKVSGIHQKMTALSKEVDTKIEKANGQQSKFVMGVSKETAQLQDMITQERRLREKGLKDVQDRIDNAELRRR